MMLSDTITRMASRWPLTSPTGGVPKAVVSQDCELGFHQNRADVTSIDVVRDRGRQLLYQQRYVTPRGRPVCGGRDQSVNPREAISQRRRVGRHHFDRSLTSQGLGDAESFAGCLRLAAGVKVSTLGEWAHLPTITSRPALAPRRAIHLGLARARPGWDVHSTDRANAPVNWLIWRWTHDTDDNTLFRECKRCVADLGCVARGARRRP